MPTIGEIGKYKIKIHSRDHNPPHVHFECAGIVVRIDIVDVAVMSIAGKPTKKEVRAMLGYVEKYFSELKEVWDELQKKD
jgi:hypothetical protein